MEINSFKDLAKERHFSEQTLNKIEERLQRSTRGADFEFTELQKTAFNTNGFWRDDYAGRVPPHMIIQGATSSGKTLVSEMAIVECLSQTPKQKAIVLVPLKAMVRERRDRFEQDLLGERVYASSSDFQDHDADIINGKYDVAVIVYEKFFAMLAQPSNEILKSCSLLVVDELQMLSSEGRGAKLEIAIQKVMRHNSELGERVSSAVYTRIMCLTTCDCKTEHIYDWLSVKDNRPLIIERSSRPVGLEEFVLMTDGTLKGQYTVGQRDDPELEKAFDAQPPEKLSVEGYDANNRYDTQKKQALFALLKRIYQNNPKSKVLVFVSERNKTLSIAKDIASQSLLPKGNIPTRVLTKLESYESDEAKSDLQSLLTHKIAFHNSSLSTALREFIEKLFSGIPDETDESYFTEDCLNLVVATETLTVGMNMPVDVMILFDHKVPRGDRVDELTSQEYKNFVGRAGRLGQSNCVGQSYILAVDKNEANQFWLQYIDCKKSNIESSLMKAKEEVHAPYYLSLLTANREYTLPELEQMQNDSFARKCGSDAIDMAKMMTVIRRASLCNEKKLTAQFDDDDVDTESYEYILNDLGAQLAPYALTPDTCKRLRRYFLNGGYRIYRSGEFEAELEPGGHGGVPLDITAEDIDQDRYLLDILYLICTTKEMRNISQFRVPAADRNSEKNADARKHILTALRKLVNGTEESPPQCLLWKESRLRYIADQKLLVETRDLQDVMRAILLWYWTKGEKVSQIRKKTNFSRIAPIYTGDLDRMAELVSYQLEAVHHIWQYSARREPDGKIIRAIYALSTRVNYGMPRNLVVIANRHLYGLDRLSVLKIGEASKSYDSPVRFLASAPSEELQGIITEQQRGELLALIGKAAGQNAIEGILDHARRDSAILSENEYSTILQLNSSEDFELRQLESLFCAADNYDPSKDDRFFRGEDISIGNFSDDNSVAVLRLREQRVNLAFYTNEQNTLPINNRFRSKWNNSEINLLILGKDCENLANGICYDKNTATWHLKNPQIDNIHVVMTADTFATILAQSISAEDRSGEYLKEFLKDISGFFKPKSIRSIYYLLQNYTLRQQGADQEEKVRILCDYRNGAEHDACDKLFSELIRRKIPFRTLPWGKPLEDERPDTALTVLYISDESLKTSRTVRDFNNRLKSHQYPNTIAFFENYSKYQNFSADKNLPECCFAWNTTNNAEEIARDIAAMRQFWRRQQNKIGEYLIGVSYSHAPVNNEERPASIWFKKVIQGVNRIFGETTVLFDGNDWCREKFDRNGAIPATLDMYRRCMYYIILDDHFYDHGPNCPKEYETIKSCKEPNHPNIWFLRPKNEKPCTLFNGEEDYCHVFEYTDESVAEVVSTIRSVIIKELGNGK